MSCGPPRWAARSAATCSTWPWNAGWPEHPRRVPPRPAAVRPVPGRPRRDRRPHLPARRHSVRAVDRGRIRRRLRAERAFGGPHHRRRPRPAQILGAGRPDHRGPGRRRPSAAAGQAAAQGDQRQRGHPDPGSHSTETPTGLRDRALLEFLYSTGARISEASGLDIDDLSLERIPANGPDVVRLFGKGSKERLVPLGSYAARALDEYLVRGRPAAAAKGKGTPRCS